MSHLRISFLSFLLACSIAVTAQAQVPNVQIYADAEFSQTIFACGEAGSIAEFNVVLNNASGIVAGADFSIEYPAATIFLFDQLPSAGFISNEVVTVGNSPTGVAIAWHQCCAQDGTQGPVVLLRPAFMWLPCNCNPASPPGNFHVRGYAPLGKTNPSYVRLEDFKEFEAIGMTSLICGFNLPVESTTWGQVKALYR